VDAINKWAERVYMETDVGRSVATSVSGVIGLVVYLLSTDWVIAAFSTIISFPIIRLVASGMHETATRRAKRRIAREEAEHLYDQLSDDEKQVVRAFVSAGGSVLTWSHVNSLSLPGPAIESLIQRELLRSSMTADGMRETFALDSSLFDVGRERSHADGQSETRPNNTVNRSGEVRRI
jgi:ABC-type multidrug transport system fused ATPase/permease subunit